MLSLLDNFNDELPEDLISGDLRIGDSPMLNSSETSNNLLNNSTPPQQVSNTTPPQQQQPQNTQTNTPPQPIQQGSPVPNSNTLNQRPPLSSPQPPPSSISTSGDPTPTMPCVSSTPAHNTAASMAGFNSNQRNSPQMMPLQSTGSTNQQMPNHSVPTNSHFASSSYNSMSGSPHPPMGHMGGPHVSPHMQHRMRHSGGIGPMRVGMPNQPHAMMHPGMSPHHGGIPRPGMGGMVPHQTVAHRMGGVPMAGGPQYMHQHPSGHHGMHPMVNPGMPNQQMGGQQNMHMMPASQMHRSNMIHHGANQAHMGNMHGGQNPRFANPNAIRTGGMNNIMQGDSQLFGGGGGGGMNMDRNPGGPIQRSNDVGGAANASRLAPQGLPHNDISGGGGGGGGGGRMMLNTGQQQQPQQQQAQQQAQQQSQQQPQQQSQQQQQQQQQQPQQQQQQQQQAMNATGQGVSTGGAANAIPPGM